MLRRLIAAVRRLRGVSSPRSRRRCRSRAIEALEQRILPAAVSLGEPGHTKDTAHYGGSLSPKAKVFTGATERLNDVDMVAIDVMAGQRLTIRIDDSWDHLRGGLRASLRVFDPLGRARWGGPHQNLTSGFQVRFTAPLPGTYYVGVSAAGNDIYSWDGRKIRDTPKSNPAAIGSYQLTLSADRAVASPILVGSVQRPRSDGLVIRNFLGSSTGSAADLKGIIEVRELLTFPVSLTSPLLPAPWSFVPFPKTRQGSVWQVGGTGGVGDLNLDAAANRWSFSDRQGSYPTNVPQALWNSLIPTGSSFTVSQKYQWRMSASDSWKDIPNGSAAIRREIRPSLETSNGFVYRVWTLHTSKHSYTHSETIFAQKLGPVVFPPPKLNRVGGNFTAGFALTSSPVRSSAIPAKSSSDRLNASAWSSTTGASRSDDNAFDMPDRPTVPSHAFVGQIAADRLQQVFASAVVPWLTVEV